jgi:hypothetical protein
MDELWVVSLLVLGPLVGVVTAYVLARCGKSPNVRKFGGLMLAAVTGLVALVSLWTVRLTIALWGLDAGGFGPDTTERIVQSLPVQPFLLVFPVSAWYLSLRFAKAAFKESQVPK